MNMLQQHYGDTLDLGVTTARKDHLQSRPERSMTVYQVEAPAGHQITVMVHPFEVDGDGTMEENRLIRLNDLGFREWSVFIDGSEYQLDPSIVDVAQKFETVLAYLRGETPRLQFYGDQFVAGMDLRDLIGAIKQGFLLIESPGYDIKPSFESDRYGEYHLALEKAFREYGRRVETMNPEYHADIQRISAQEAADAVTEAVKALAELGEDPLEALHNIHLLIKRYCPSGFSQRLEEATPVVQ